MFTLLIAWPIHNWWLWIGAHIVFSMVIPLYAKLDRYYEEQEGPNSSTAERRE